MCISYNNLKKLKKGNYSIVIDSKFKKGHSYMGDYLIKGKLKIRIKFSRSTSPK